MAHKQGFPSRGGAVATYTVATVPAASSVPADTIIFVSDAPTADQYAVSDGTDWRHIDPNAGTRDFFGGDSSIWRDNFTVNDLANYGNPPNVQISGGTINPTGYMNLEAIPATAATSATGLVVVAKHHLGTGSAYNGLVKYVDATHIVYGFYDPDISGLKIGQNTGSGYVELTNSGTGISRGDNWLVLVVDPAANTAAIHRYNGDPEGSGVATKSLSIGINAALADGAGYPGLMFSASATIDYYADNLSAFRLGEQPFTLP